ncbi:hypothetical protein RB2654_13950 [Rhodobacterales bacterium HTCC2654]|uniref:Uncharacterized protein n=1 Tax=Maritimibacter alkaliphilus HTCC2654 TaxID=314271 RepID=A3VGI9_9RHOB|nr:hypothetical protein RB2654_13950 [Rhodobacterales bacterium HTCC2654] [Maritimibacter alkaliphilus HTCC2654]
MLLRRPRPCHGGRRRTRHANGANARGSETAAARHGPKRRVPASRTRP